MYLQRPSFGGRGELSMAVTGRGSGGRKAEGRRECGATPVTPAQPRCRESWRARHAAAGRPPLNQARRPRAGRLGKAAPAWERRGGSSALLPSKLGARAKRRARMQLGPARAAMPRAGPCKICCGRLQNCQQMHASLVGCLARALRRDGGGRHGDTPAERRQSRRPGRWPLALSCQNRARQKLGRAQRRPSIGAAAPVPNKTGAHRRALLGAFRNVCPSLATAARGRAGS